nr:unnamed protein product [Callosobruchus chinensis]
MEEAEPWHGRQFPHLPSSRRYQWWELPGIPRSSRAFGTHVFPPRTIRRGLPNPPSHWLWWICTLLPSS